MTRKNSLIADDHPAMRDGVKQILTKQFSEIEFGEAANAIEVFKSTTSHGQGHRDKQSVGCSW